VDHDKIQGEDFCFDPWSEPMYAYRVETIISPFGELQLTALPFRPGEAVEVIILATNDKHDVLTDFPLKNTVLKYEDPTEPVAEDDWDVLQ
jgi:hypothetical protein